MTLEIGPSLANLISYIVTVIALVVLVRLSREVWMCKWGTETILRVPMPANLSHNGEFRWEEKGIDSCIAPLVQALNDAGIYTANCCCGHGKEAGTIMLHDGRVLRIEVSHDL